MPFNSFKDDEKTIEVGKMATLMRLFKYLLAYKKTDYRSPFYHGLLRGCQPVEPAYHGISGG